MQHWFYDIELSPAFIAAKGPDATPQWQEKSAIATNVMLRAMTEQTTLHPQQRGNFLRQIREGLIDPDALVDPVSIAADGTRTSLSKKTPLEELKLQPGLRPQRLIRFLTNEGQCGAELMQALLDKATNPQCKAGPELVRGFSVLETLYERVSSRACPYVDVILGHPSTDLNAVLSQDHWRFDTRLLDLFIGVHRRLEQEPEGLVKRTTHALQQALAHGMVPDQHWFSIARSKPDIHRVLNHPAVKPYYDHAQDVLATLRDGPWDPNRVSVADLGALYSIGKLQEAMQPQRWTGHEEQALALYDSLPNFVQKECPCEHERTIFYALLSPLPLIHTASLRPDNDHTRMQPQDQTSKPRK